VSQRPQMPLVLLFRARRAAPGWGREAVGRAVVRYFRCGSLCRIPARGFWSGTCGWIGTSIAQGEMRRKKSLRGGGLLRLGWLTWAWRAGKGKGAVGRVLSSVQPHDKRWLAIELSEGAFGPGLGAK
jgi:hypothetical protein